MATIDKAAIGWSIAIVAVGVGFAFWGMGDYGTMQTSSPPVQQQASIMESQTAKDPFADIVAKVKENPTETKESVKVEEKATMEKSEDKKMEEPKAAPAPETAPAPSGPKTVNVDIPAGTSIPGCEETDACFVPATVTINSGDTVAWTNSDTAAHTVTGGSPADGPSGVFDSSLLMGAATFEHTFNDAGSYEYFCMVHPWMVGTVQVN